MISSPKKRYISIHFYCNLGVGECISAREEILSVYLFLLFLSHNLIIFSLRLYLVIVH